MAEEEQVLQQQHHEIQTPGSKLDAIVSQCFISPSQEEILRELSGWKQLQSEAQSFEETECFRDIQTVGAPETAMDTPDTTQMCQTSKEHQSQEEQEGEEQSVGVSDSFELKFESDRDQSQSQSLNTQCFGATTFPLVSNADLLTPPAKPKFQLPEASSVNSKTLNLTSIAHHNDEIIAKPVSCRRLIVSEEKEEEGLNRDYGQFFDSHDFNQIDTQGFHSQLAPANKLAESEGGGQGEANEEGGACRILPTSLLQRDTATALLETEGDPKRRRKEAAANKPFPRTLMEVILHYSGAAPMGVEDVDIVETAIGAGITFPPPFSRRYCSRT